MARRKKNETVGGGGTTAAAVKPPPTTIATTSTATIPVRKSSRQIARKQSIDAIDGKKQNGELLNKLPAAAATTPITNKESTKNIQKNSSQIIVNEGGEKITDVIEPPIAPRKRGRPRLSGNRNTNKINNTKNINSLTAIDNCLTEVEKNLDKIENDSKEILETSLVNENTNLNVVTDIVVSNEDVIISNCHEITNEVDTTEEVIEETIVCEEMEVEIDGNTDEININSNEYIIQDENICNEQIIIMDESRFEDDNNVVLLIDNKNETMITNSEDIVTTNEYEIIEESIECLTLNDQQNGLVNNQDEIKKKSESCRESQQFISTYDDVEDQLPASLIENIQSRNNSIDNVVEENDLSIDCSSRDVFDEIKNTEEISNTSTTTTTTVNEQLTLQENLNIEDNLSENTEMIIETIVEESPVEISTNDVNNEIDITGTILSEKIYNIELDSNSHDITISENIVEIETESILIQEEDSAKLNENSYIELSQNNEDCSRESIEIDVKNYSDDMKTDCNNSASENSNDTLLSNNISKTDDSTELKVQNQIDGGSTDTTGSENGSNSSGIRRSSRIRSQGLMKQRSRGRGLVTKPIADVTKAMQEREKLELTTGQSRLGHYLKKDSVSTSSDNNCNSSEVQSDTQSDKENTNKSVDLFDLNTATTTITSSSSLSVVTATTTTTPATATTPPPPPPPPPTTVSPSTMSSSSIISCDSDTIKPVKVKSRWRRISELEMGSTTGYLPSSTPLTSNSSFGNLTNDHNSAHGSFSSIDNNESILSTSSCPDNSTSIKSTIEMNNKIIDDNIEHDSVNDEQLNNHNKLSTTVGEKKMDNLSKNKLPIIREEIYDRELAERLSQFERIKENLYLSQRYINKETKRMVCDCFLTDEDIERGELGCGEDCLNRLLMIECGSRCIVNNRCTNKRFQKCKYSGCEVFRTEKKGFGLRATNDILPGEFIMEYVGEVLNPKDFRRRAKEYSKDKNKHYYFMALKSDQIIDATVKGNISRFINHSCDPNSETQKWTVNGELRIGFFNRRFISAGEEITFDYHFQRYGKEAQKCYCESANCRGWIGDTPEEEKDKLRKKKDNNNKIDNDYFSSSSSSMASSSSSSTMSSPSPSPSPSLSYPSPSPSPTPSVTSLNSTTTIKASKTTASTSSSATKTTTATRTRKKKEIKNPFMEDEDLEEEIEKLCAIGLKNRSHTLNLSRLMVRSRESEHRNRLLKVIQNGEPACRRLFLDYHGLRLIWSYMMDVGNSETKELQQFKIELLKTLNTLPIPNKTMLMDSKVYDVVQKWSNDSDDNNKLPSKNLDLPIIDNKQNEIKKNDDEKIENNCDNNEIISNDEKYNNKNDNSSKSNNDNDDNNEDDDNKIKMIIELAKSILDKWSNLKEVFRIPKKERIEQMKEHEREADIGYREDSEKEDRRDSYDRQRTDRYSGGGGRRDELISSTSTSSSSLLVLTSRDRRSINKGRDSPDLDTLYRNKQDNNKRLDERTNLVPLPRLSKYERRQLFALEVAKKEEAERLRRQQQNTWHEHESRCHALGIDPYTTPLADLQTGYPIFFDQLHGQWQPYPPSSIQEPPEMQIPHCNSMYMPTNSQPIQQQQQQQPPIHSMIGPQLNSHQHQHQPGMPIEALTSTMSTPSISMYDMNQQTPYQTQYSNSNLITLHSSSNTSSNININCVTPKTVPVQSAQHMYMNSVPLEKPTINLSSLTVIDLSDNKIAEEETPPTIIDLPPKWKSAKDPRGRVYYYHIKERIPQWLPPAPIHIGLEAESSSSSESSEEESSSSDEDAEVGNDLEDDFNMMDDDDGNSTGIEECIKGVVRTDPRTACFAPEPKKRRNGLVQERIISPRREEDRVDRKKHKILKEKLRRHKERGKHKSTKEHGEKVRKHRRSNKSKTHSKHTETKLQAIAQSNDLSAERKIKDTFRINMANVIVRFLNPHRQNDCKQGRITNTEDFKYLARKLTHFVLAKELKHCKSVDELQCNENVKHKAKDFVRKYMNKFGPVYQRSFDED